MGRALEVVTGVLTTSALTAGTYDAYTANSGQSFSIRASSGQPSASLLAPWSQAGTKGYVQIKSPRMHDTTIGTTFAAQVGTAAFGVEPLASLDYDEPGYSTDTLTVQFTPATTIAAATSMGIGLPVYYTDLNGVDASLATWATISSLANASSKVGDHYVSWVSASSAATAGQIGVGAAINSTNDQFKANHSYALLGYLPQAQVGSVLLQGTDTGNLYVGGPGSLDVKVTRNFFVDLSLAQGLPLIPVIQANNRANTFVSVVDASTTSTATVVGLVWMDLGILSSPIAA